MDLKKVRKNITKCKKWEKLFQRSLFEICSNLLSQNKKNCPVSFLNFRKIGRNSTFFWTKIQKMSLFSGVDIYVESKMLLAHVHVWAYWKIYNWFLYKLQTFKRKSGKVPKAAKIPNYLRTVKSHFFKSHVSVQKFKFSCSRLFSVPVA